MFSFFGSDRFKPFYLNHELFLDSLSSDVNLGLIYWLFKASFMSILTTSDSVIIFFWSPIVSFSFSFSLCNFKTELLNSWICANFDYVFCFSLSIYDIACFISLSLRFKAYSWSFSIFYFDSTSSFKVCFSLEIPSSSFFLSSDNLFTSFCLRLISSSFSVSFFYSSLRFFFVFSNWEVTSFS